MSISDLDLDDLQKAFNTVLDMVNRATIAGRELTSLKRQVNEFGRTIDELHGVVKFLSFDTGTCAHEKFKAKRGIYCPQCGRIPGSQSDADLDIAIDWAPRGE